MEHDAVAEVLRKAARRLTVVSSPSASRHAFPTAPPPQASRAPDLVQKTRLDGQPDGAPVSILPNMASDSLNCTKQLSHKDLGKNDSNPMFVFLNVVFCGPPGLKKQTFFCHPNRLYGSEL